MTINQINKLKPGRLRALTGITVNALGELLTTSEPELVQRRQLAKLQMPDRKRAVGGGAKRKLAAAQEVLLVLIYLRHNVAHEVTGRMFGVRADTGENLFHAIVPWLRDLFPSNRFEAEKRFRRQGPSLRVEEIDRILIDSFETPLPRPSNKERQKRVYSGKKTCHTLKTQVVSAEKGEVLGISAGHRGPMADKRVYEASGVAEQFGDVSKQGDPGYQGTEGIQVPHKKPQGGELSDEQKEENRAQASVRVAVEHGIRRVKGVKIVREKYRLAMGLFPMVASAVVGLVQLNRILV
ncbi:MAG TPA: transposase family protein [Blastocatellia bacterium]|nr:transposase family protein [Blastocatellia bacterium]